MHKIVLVLGCLLTLFVTSASAHILSSDAHLEGTLNPDTIAFFVGKTDISGDFGGFQVDESLSPKTTTFFESMTTTPIFGSSILKGIDKVIIVDIDDIESYYSIDDIFSMQEDNIYNFSHVTITTDSGSFILGSENGNMEVESKIDYAISGIFSFEVTPGEFVSSLVVITTSQLKMNATGELFVLMQLSDSGNISIKDSAEDVIWKGDATNKIFLIEDTSFSVTQNSTIYPFPLSSQNEYNPIKLSVSPADSKSCNLSSLLDKISSSTLSFGGMYLSNLSDNMQIFGEFLSTTSAVVDGAMVLARTNDTFIIDGTSQTFSEFGFVRSDNLNVVISSVGGEPAPQVTGECKLIFLGDHFYTAQAKDSEKGIAFPVIIVVIWGIAVVLYLLLHFYLKKEINGQYDKKIKTYALIFHIAALITAFILMDQEISYQFGISAIDSIINQGVSITLVIFIILELIIWGIGFVCFAIPIRMITNSILRMFGIEKGGKRIGKGVGAIFIWVFCAFYIKLFINIALSMIDLRNFIPV